ncbi:MAG: glutamate formimidoyltransferase [Proteobacteria bacterium]|nr:glutamate formimidoyltransferase [Pseudomonadota bacterium]
MNQLIECVPNFSEGRNPETISQIEQAILSVPGVTILDIKPGIADNRTVFTFVGSPEAVCEAAFQSIKTAQQLIDMRHHRGAHLRMGATDVCPLVPVKGISLKDCAVLARELGERVAEECTIPVFLYEASARTPQRQRLPDLRKGEYEALPEKLQDPLWGPDFGPTDFNESVARSGGTVIGARPFLIAWNVNLSTLNQRKAEKIASRIKEKGYVLRDSSGKIKKDNDGNTVKAPGLFKNVNAVGWTIDEYGCCQISINLTNHHISPIHKVYDAIRKLALEENVVVTGSELVGLIPEEALYNAGVHYLEQAGENPSRPHSDILDMAIRSLGLSELAAFNPDKAILERQLFPDGPLVSMSVRAFNDLLSSSAPAPGGGSVAALAGSLSCSLSAMVSQLSTKITKKNWPYGQPRPAHWSEFDKMGLEAQQEKENFLHDIDADTAAFDAIMKANQLPKQTPEQKSERKKAIHAATIEAIEIPLRNLRRAQKAIELAKVALKGNPNARSDAGVAVSMARACAEGTWMNVCINLQDLKDEDLKSQYAQEADHLLRSIRTEAEKLFGMVEEELRFKPQSES